MSLEDQVSVSITSTSVTPTRESFGIGLLMAQKVPAGFINRVYEFFKPSDLTAFGFSVNDPAYLAAVKYFGSTPRPKSLKIGKRLLGTTQTIKLTCLSATAGDVYTITVVNQATGVSTTITRTVPGASTTSAEATAIAALINAVTGFAASAVGAVITCTATGGAGVLQNYLDWSPNFSLKDNSADPGIATDLAAVQAEDSDWYGLILDSCSKAELLAAATWAEANTKLFPGRNCDTEIGDNAVTTDVISTGKASAYVRTGGIATQNNLLGFIDAGIMGEEFARDPGTSTWKFKTVPGVKADKWSASQYSTIKTKRGNLYSAVAGINMLEDGITFSGRFFDSVRGQDWLTSEIKTRVFALLASLPKVPFTDAGVDAVVSVIKGALQDAIKRGYIAASPAPVVTAPKVVDVDALSKAARLLPNIEFSCTEAGAVHKVTINGVVSV